MLIVISLSWKVVYRSIYNTWLFKWVDYIKFVGLTMPQRFKNLIKNNSI